MRWRAAVSTRPRGAIAFAAKGVAVAVLIAYAVTSTGQPVHHASLNDGGIWVVNQQEGYWGRFNKPAEQLDGAFWSPVSDKPDLGTALDVLQDGSTVAAWDRSLSSRQLYPVDVSAVRGLRDRAVTVSAAPGPVVTLGGGTAADIDPGTGRLRLARGSDGRPPDLTALDVSRKAAAVRPLGAAATVAVGVDGHVYAASGRTGRALALAPARRGAGFDPPAYRTVPVMEHVAVTAVGDRPVIYDTDTGRLVLPDGKVAAVPRGAVLQQPGPDAGAVVLATSGGLWSVSLSKGAVTDLAAGGGGAVAAPVLLGGTIHAAWGGDTPSYVQVKGAVVRRRPIPPTNRGVRSVTSPVFRVNRGQILLNDAADGGLWLVDQQQVKAVDDWPAVENPQQSAADTPPDPARLTASKDAPQAADQNLLARPGRTSVLHLLDGVKDPSGAQLAIVGVTQPADARSDVARSADLQTVSLQLPADAAGPTSFTYTISDGRHPPSTGRVTVTPPSGADRKPYLSNYSNQPGVNVASAGTVSIPVLNDWRDPENDALSVQSVTASAGQAALQPDSRLRYTAPPAPGSQNVTYVVSDGFGGSANGRVSIHVLGSSEPAAAAVALDDVASAVPGVPVTFSPLDNDLPGADPAHPDAQLALAGQIAAVSAGLNATADLAKGEVTVSAPAAGDYTFTYADAFGAAPVSSVATVRVVVRAADSSLPVAAPDVATLHGLHAAIVDVLANDFSPSGGMLGVLSASVDAHSTGRLQATVVKSRWLQIEALSPGLGTGSIEYTISDGHQQATGQVSVVQVPDALDPTPLAVDDFGTVRAGDVASVPVLDNDVDPDGEPLSLVSAVLDGGTSLHPYGVAGVSGNLVRYAAPASISVPTSVVLDYGLRDLSGDQATGRVYLTVIPAPPAGDASHDQPPVPRAVTATVVAGGSVVLNIPTSGVDPDGDAVSVVGLDSAPSLGRIAKITAGSMTYTAFPGSVGTDVFSYVVEDRYGERGSGDVQVLVLPPGPLPAPLAVDDAVRARPGAMVSVPVLDNDVIAPGDVVSVVPLRQTNSPDVLSEAHLDLTDPLAPLIDVRIPRDATAPLTLVYGLTDGSAPLSLARLVASPDPSFAGLPPVPRDDSATGADIAAGSSSVVVDVLPNDRDWDGTTGGLTLPREQPASQAEVVPCVRHRGQCLSLPIRGAATDAAYVVRNAAGLSAVGVVHVPGTADLQAPHLRPGAGPIRVGTGASVTVSLSDFVVVRAQHTAKLYQADSAFAAPRTSLTVASTYTSITLTAAPGYEGPAAVVIEVTDGSDAADPAGLRALLTIPVQVGRDVPVLTCPADVLPVVVDSERDVALSTYCHLWVADGDSTGQVRFSVRSQAGAPGLTARVRAQILILSASASASAGSAGKVTVTPTGPGGDGTAVPVPVLVVAAPQDVLRPSSVTLKAGTSVRLDLTPYLSPVLPHARVQAGTSAPAQAGVSVSAAGSTLTVTADAAAHGARSFAVQATDAPGNPQRLASGTLSVTVIGAPDRPGAPYVVGRPTSRTIELAWPQPADNGSVITSYSVKGSDGVNATCTAAPCSITGLTNGQSYTFRVVAHNVVGASDPSDASPPASPQAVPGLVRSVVAPHFGGFRVTWSAERNQDDGSVDTYSLEAQPPIEGLPTSLPSSDTSYDIVDGFDVDTAYVINVVAHNAYGSSGDTNTGPVQAWSTPDWAGAAPRVVSQTQGAADHEVVTVSWPGVDWKGPPGSYSLKADGGTAGACSTNPGGSGICRLPQDGRSVSFHVVAVNGAGVTTDSPSSAPITAVDQPDAPTSTGAVPSGADNGVRISYSLGDAHDSSGPQVLEWAALQQGPFTTQRRLGPSPATVVDAAIPDGPTCSIWLRAVNAHGQASTAVQVPRCVGPYGSPDAPVLDVTSRTDGSGRIVWDWSAQPGGGHGQTLSTYQLSLDGGTPESTTATEFAHTFTDFGSTHTLSVEFVGQRPLLPGQAWPSGTGTGSTGSAPQPTISASEGGRVVVQHGDTVCTQDPGCPALNFTVHNFPVASYYWKCEEQGQVYFDSQTYGRKITIASSDESFVNEPVCVDSDVGVTVSIVINVNGVDITGSAPFS